jgi:ribonuclease P protein component
MPTPHRLRKHADYQHAYARSRKQFTKQMTYFFAPRSPDRRSDTAGPRIGLTVPKALGKAHDRNRIKRRLRAVVAANLPLLTAPVDVILHPRRSVLTLEFAHLNREIAIIFRAVQTALNRAPTQGSAVAFPAREPRLRAKPKEPRISSAPKQGGAPADPASDRP